LGYQREGAGQKILVLANFSEHPQTCATKVFQAMPDQVQDLVADQCVDLRADVVLPPYAVMWLVLA